jgi:hypothetical protein
MEFWAIAPVRYPPDSFGAARSFERVVDLHEPETLAMLSARQLPAI